MTLEDRLNLIIKEAGISKAEFARRLGVTVNYVYILTGNSREGKKPKLSPSLAKLIALEFGYNDKWILTGEEAQIK